MTPTTRPTTGNTTYHRDGTMTWWSCVQERWLRGAPTDAELATMGSDERSRAIAHCPSLRQAEALTYVRRCSELGQEASRRALAEWSGYLTERTARAALDELAAAGAIEAVASGGRPMGYRVTTPPGVE